MPTAENAKLEYESGQSSFAMAAITDSGDLTLFNTSASLFSGKSGNAPVVRPNGLATGGAIVAAVLGGNDNVDVSALTVYLSGVKTAVAGSADNAITRPATAVSKVNSITITAAGAIAVVAGTDGATTAFVETRGAAGGPPYIDVDAVEVGQVRLVSETPAAITAAQILQVVGTHRERYDFPLWDELNSVAQVQFKSALPAIHTGDVGKAVFASYADPIFAEVSLAADFVAPETSHSVSSTQIYGNTLGSSTKTLNQGAFTAFLNDGVTDQLVVLKDATLWFKFTPDKFKLPHLLSQGKLGISRTFPAGDNLQAACTISASEAAIEVES